MGSMRQLRKQQLEAYDITPAEAIKKYDVSADDLLAKIKEEDSPLCLMETSVTEDRRYSNKKVPWYLLRTKDLDKIYQLRPIPEEVTDVIKDVIQVTQSELESIGQFKSGEVVLLPQENNIEEVNTNVQEE